MIDSSFVYHLSDAVDRGRAGIGETYSLPFQGNRFYIENVVSNKDVERCVMPDCKRETPYLRNTPVYERTHYVEGAGQLCESCYTLTYGGRR